MAGVSPWWSTQKSAGYVRGSSTDSSHTSAPASLRPNQHHNSIQIDSRIAVRDAHATLPTRAPPPDFTEPRAFTAVKHTRQRHTKQKHPGALSSPSRLNVGRHKPGQAAARTTTGVVGTHPRAARKSNRLAGQRPCCRAVHEAPHTRVGATKGRTDLRATSSGLLDHRRTVAVVVRFRRVLGDRRPRG